ncbi:hypothetical protein Salat_2727300 [Sesamum alatum]|uniref:Uncharacterized protein n=1 Tax=Sesamum alatum TaxID=300844 RepID=A0AAE2C8Q6_9LAMI|nr:hypothetical protein Salat_2727300 [Sesamum alatum]
MEGGRWFKNSDMERQIKVYSPPTILDENARVAEFIHDDGHSWKEDLVCDLFPAELAEHITLPDQLKKKNGENVAQSYITLPDQLKKKNGENVAQSKLHDHGSSFGSPMSLTVLSVCMEALLMWALSDLLWATLNDWKGGCEEWMQTCFDWLTEDEFAWLLMICLMIWNNKNSKVMEGTSEDPLQQILRTKRYLHAFTEAHARAEVGRGRHSPGKWNRPPVVRVAALLAQLKNVIVCP